MDSSVKVTVTGVRTIGVPVTDQDRALDFYLGRLGLEKRLDMPLEQLGGRWIEVGPVGFPVSIALVPSPGADPGGVDTGIRLTVEDAGAVHAALGSQGVEVGELLRWPGTPPMFALRDQDGNKLEIVEQPSGSACRSSSPPPRNQ
jgi:catechol 2,3-dioxygenase-like lactoylglutathione lyase family enzyme